MDDIIYIFKAAINQGNKEEVARLLDTDPTLLEKAPLLGVTPLMQAAMAGHVKVVKLLVRKGANVRARAHAGFTCSLGCSALDYAAQGGHEEVVAYLLRKGAPANTRDKHGITPLMNACRQGHVGTVRMLVKHTKKQGLGKADYFGRTALHVATENGHEKVVAYLLRKGAKATSRDRNGMTPLMVACKGGHLAVARLFVYYLRAYYGLSGWLGQGLEMNCHDGSTALHYAAERGHVKMVAMLLEEGAQANSMDRYGRTPLMMACQGCHVGVARLLLEQGGEGLEVRDDEESTALHHAAEGGHEQIIRFLLLAGANSTPKNKYGTTPRDLAMATGDPQCTRVFDWWEGKRRYALQRARCLHDAYTVHRIKPAAPVPAYLQERAAAGQALPQVDVVTRQQQATAGARGKRKRSEAGASTEQEEERKAAVLTYVLTQLDSALFTELVECLYLYDPSD